MKLKTTLLKALNAADLISVDGNQAEFNTLPQRIGYFCMELADETFFDFVDQDIELDDGKAFFDDAGGDDHELILSVERRLTEDDIR